MTYRYLYKRCYIKVYNGFGNGVTLILIKNISSRYMDREDARKVFSEKVRNSVTKMPIAIDVSTIMTVTLNKK